MIQVFIYSLLLITGIGVSQFADLSSVRYAVTALTMVCLSYIMIEVGLEFTIDKKNLKSYAVDYGVAATAAAFPWIFCAAYLVWVFGSDIKEALLVGRFAAPTSAGVLFTMLAAAGLATTWLFKKARVLAIFDDLDTVLFMIPLKMMIVGLKPELLGIVLVIFVLLAVAYIFIHQLKIPTSRFWCFAYGVVIFLICDAIYRTTNVHLEVLLPAFVLGCILYNPHDPNNPEPHSHEHQFMQPEKRHEKWLDQFVKALFMFLVGCSLPKLDLAGVAVSTIALHVLILTVLSNIGKCFPLFCYKKEADFRTRLALCVAMFPRGEVGAGVLLVSIGYGLTGLPVAIGGLSLALNLLLTGFFIWLVQKLIRKEA